MATINQVLLVAATQLTASDAVYYTPPSVTSAKIGRAVFSNPDTAAHTITVNIVATSGSASAANQIINARSLAPGETYVSPELAGAVLPPGSSLHALADTAAKVVLMVSGLTIVQ
jgi:hypothetical protein